MHSLIVEPHANWTKLVLNRPAVNRSVRAWRASGVERSLANRKLKASGQ